MWLRSCIPVFLLSCTLAASAQEPAPAAKPQPDIATPVSAEKPLPNLETLIARAKANADAMAELTKSYTCKQVVVADEFDSHGNKKGTHTDEYQIFYVEKKEIAQHVAHDGKPLSDGDKKKEQERVDKRIQDIRAHKEKEHPGVVLRASSLLKVATISAPRRQMLNGRPTIYFDYKGNPSAKTDNLGEEVMKKLTGTIALDEHDAVIVLLNGTLQENFHVLGGLAANIKKGSHFQIESVRINDEVWFTRSFNGHVDGRILLFKGFDGDANITYSDYRKMKTTVTLLPGSQVIGEDGKPIPNIEAEPVTPPVPQ